MYDSYRRFVQMYGDVVLGLKPVHKDEIDPFEVIIEAKKKAKGVHLDTDLTADDMKELVGAVQDGDQGEDGSRLPAGSDEAALGRHRRRVRLLEQRRAIAYRKMYDIPESWGTAVNIQSMVFGNMGEDSGTGVAFTRDAATGENIFYGEFLMNAQGEDVVAGTRTPLPIAKLQRTIRASTSSSMRSGKKLEKHYRDMMDIEFTIQQGKLYMLQCRVGKRTAFAAIKIAVDMVAEKLITDKEALAADRAGSAEPAPPPDLRPEGEGSGGEGRPAAGQGSERRSGCGDRTIVFNAPDAEEWKSRGEQVILTRIETSPEDIKGMNAAEGILTARGGMTSHAALVARQMGKVCVAGCSIARHRLRDAYDGGEGQVAQGRRLDLDRRHHRRSDRRQGPDEAVGSAAGADRQDPGSEGCPGLPAVRQVMAWADKYRRLKIRTNADQPDQAAQRDRVRRRRHRPLPHRAHVLRRREDRSDARNDSGRHGRRSQEGAGEAAAAAARGLRGHLQGDGRPAGDHPDDRSAAARVRAARRKGTA